jgi:hypothetical protein
MLYPFNTLKIKSVFGQFCNTLHVAKLIFSRRRVSSQVATAFPMLPRNVLMFGESISICPLVAEIKAKNFRGQAVHEQIVVCGYWSCKSSNRVYDDRQMVDGQVLDFFR